jgi:hypothetical protein
MGLHRANQKWTSTFKLGDPNNWGSIIHPEDLSVAQEAYSNAIETGKGYDEPLELRVLDVSKERHYIDVRLRPMCDCR